MWFVKLMLTIAFGLAMDFWAAWFAMLGIGAAHANTAIIPALPYETMFWLTFSLTGIVAAAVVTDKFSDALEDD